MNYLSVCSGIEAASVAWHPLGWEAVAFSEIEPFPCKVLAHHYPKVPNYGDMTKFKEWPDAKIDVLVGGTPCQSFSIAGLRKGLDDPRGNLMLTYLAIAAKYRPEWLVWENVPGVLSSNCGKDFGTFLAGLGECGYGFAYRVLDAQYVRTDGYPYAVPQRRRRVFVVGCIGDWRRAAAVLFDSESLRGNPPPRRKAREEVAGTVGARTGRSIGAQDAACGHMHVVAPTLDAHYGDKMGLDNQHINAGGGCSSVAKTLITKIRLDAETETLIPTIGGGFDVAQAYSFDSMSSNSMKSSNPASGCNQVDVAKCLDTSRGLDPSCNQGGMAVISLAGNTIGREPQNGGNGTGYDESGSSYTLTKTDVHGVAYPIDTQNMTENHASGGKGFGELGDPSFTLTKGHVHAVAFKVDSLYNTGIRQGDINASTQKTYAGNLLSRVRKEIGTQAFAEWGLGILDSLQEKEILRQVLYGKEFRQAPFSRSWVVCCTLGSPFTYSEGAMQSLREACGDGCSSQGWESLKQFSGELGTYLSELSQPGAQAERFMQDLWEADEGIGILRETLSEIQKIRRSDVIQNKPAYSNMQVRRLTVGECTFLQGFPRNYLSQVPGYSDSAAYKALGNSMAVNVMQLIGQRIQMVSEIKRERIAA